MAKTQSKLNNANSEKIEENVLQENPEGLPEVNNIVIAKTIPPKEEKKRVIFLNGRDPGIALEFHYHSATHPLERFTLYHGLEVDLPVEIIEHLESCGEHIYGYRPGPEGHPQMYTKSMKYIFSCKPVNSATKQFRKTA
jgi:hypothetical protein